MCDRRSILYFFNGTIFWFSYFSPAYITVSRMFYFCKIYIFSRKNFYKIEIFLKAYFYAFFNFYSHASNSMRNESKNRFLDIKAYDESRVILKTEWTINEKSRLSISTTSSEEFDEPSDYINANFVQGFSHEKKFIATQGPKKETLVDFWRMVYQYRVSAIIMLTKLIERGVERCTQYWPEKIGISETYGEFEVTMKEQLKCGDYLKRTFDLEGMWK